MYIKIIEKTASVETVAAQQKQKKMDEKLSPTSIEVCQTGYRKSTIKNKN